MSEPFNSQKLTEEQLHARIYQLMAQKAYSTDDQTARWNPWTPKEVLMRRRLEKKYIQDLTYGGEKNRNRIQGGKLSSRRNNWIQFVKDFARDNNVSYRTALMEAGKYYKG